LVNYFVDVLFHLFQLVSGERIVVANLRIANKKVANIHVANMRVANIHVANKNVANNMGAWARRGRGHNAIFVHL
jgi:hypothetical protein